MNIKEPQHFPAHPPSFEGTPSLDPQQESPLTNKRERAPIYAVVIPAYNEEKTIFDIARQSLVHCSTVIVVDDGSTDHTSGLLQNLPITLLRHSKNMGKAASLWRGLQYAHQLGMTAVVTLDGDGQHSPSDIPRLMSQAELNPHSLIIGARKRKWTLHTWHRILANRLADFWVSWAAGHPIADSQSGFRVYPLSLMEQLTIPTGKEYSFVFESEVLIEGAKHGYWTIPVTIANEPRQAPRPSYFHPIFDIMRITKMVAKKLVSYRLSPFMLYHGLFGNPLKEQNPKLSELPSSSRPPK